jgi:hypothetical protein
VKIADASTASNFHSLSQVRPVEGDWFAAIHNVFRWFALKLVNTSIFLCQEVGSARNQGIINLNGH